MSLAKIAEIAGQFGASGKPERLSGGQDQSWKVATKTGDIVVKPAPHSDEAHWAGHVFSEANFAQCVRVPQPVPTANGDWIEQGYVAWTWIEGRSAPGNYRQKIISARAFHAGLKSLSYPEFMERRCDPWAMADRVAWGQKAADYDANSMAALVPVLEMIADTPLPSDCRDQIVHGDLSGNYVFAEGARSRHYRHYALLATGRICRGFDLGRCHLVSGYGSAGAF